MKNQIQSYVGMRLGGCRLIDTLITHLSPTNHPLKHGIGKYIFSFLLVLAMSVGQMWALKPDLTPTVAEGNTPAVPATALNMTTQEFRTPDANGWIVFYTKGVVDQSGITWWGKTQTNGGTATWAVPTGASAPEAPYVGGSSTNRYTINTSRCHAIRFTGAEKLSFLVKDHASRTIIVKLYSYTATPEESLSLVTTKQSSNSAAVQEILFSSLTTSTDYVAYIYCDNSSNVDLYEVGVKGSSSSDPVAVTGITLAPSSATIKVGKTVTLVPTITPSDATDKAVTWAVTSGSTYASVSDAGVVTGLVAGSAVITATAHDGSGVTQTAAITVEDCPTSGTLFSMTITDPDGTVYTDVTNAAPQLIGATYVGGKAYATSTSSSKRSPKITGDEFDFNVGSSSSVAVKVELDCPLAEGDIISFTSTHTKEFKIQKVAGTNLHQTSSLSLAIPSGSSLIDEDVFYVLCANSACSFSEINIIRPIYRTITLEYADGETPDGSLEVVDGTAATKPADPTWAHHRFDGWYNGASPYDWTATVSSDLTLTAHWTQLYTVTYAAGDAGATGDAPTQADKAATETFKVAANTFELAGKVFDHWNDGSADYNPNDTYTVGTSNVTLTAVWRTPSTMYAITEGTHTNGSITIDPVEQEEGEIVTLEATPDENYLFDAWEIVKSEDASATGITVDANGQFEMPAYAVTVNASFIADPRQKVLYVTSTAEATVKGNDKLYDALKDIYNVKIVGPTSDADQSGYALIVLHESVGGGSYDATAVAAAKAGNKPVLNTKSYFYNDGRWGWGTPNAGQTVKGATLNNAYCNIADHPLFSGVTVTDGFFEITDDAAAKCMQPLGSFAEGKEGYTLATTPNNGTDAGNGCAIHELTPTQRGASAGKYLMISVSNAKIDALNANGQKLFQNAAAYLIGSTSWDPIAALSSPEVTASPSAAYSLGDNISLTASATGTSAATTYTWYKGDSWAAAESAGAIQATKTVAEGGNTYAKAGSVLGDAGIYWCVISNGTDCDVKASLEITVVDASFNIAFSSAHGTAPSATTGVSYLMPELTASGWAHQGWTADINVFVDLEEVTAGTLIANGKTAVFGSDVTFTAVWKQEFQVTFNLNGHGAPIAAQVVVDGALATDPGDPSEIGYDFGGWFTDEDCTVGNEFNFTTPITANTPLYAKWTAFGGCTLLVPATSGDPLAVGDPISMQIGSKGGSMSVVGTPLSYNAYGLSFESSSSAKAKVTINSEIQEGTVISLTLVANGTSSPRGLHLYSGDGATKIESLGWTSDMTKYDEAIFTYTVQSTDVALIGSNEFQLWRNGSVFLKQLTVTNCGDPIIFHDLTSAIVPDNDPAYATVTLGASSVREGHTTTATYSDINAAYEFDEWQISGAGASIADASANPAVITMGTVDAVVTLKLKVATPKHTVTFNKMGTGDDVPSQLVKEGDLVPEPSVAEPEGWILEGWYKESTFETKWNFASDVMGTSDMELFAKWVADASIKLIVDGASGKELNAAAYYTGSSLTTVEIADENHACVKLAGGATAATAPYSAGQNDNRVIAYCSTTTATKIQVIAYSNTNSARPYTISFVEEGQTADQADDNNVIVNLPTDGTIHTSDWYQFNSSKNRTIYITIPGNASNYHFLQVKVIESGTAIKKAGDIGYSMNFNVGRPIGKKQTLHSNFEGFDFYANNDYKVLQSTSMVISNATNDYIKFHAAAPMTLAVTTETASYFYVTKDAKGTDNETLSTAGGTSYIDLDAAADWYISPKNGDVKIQNIAFTAPMCAEPTIDAQPVTNVTFGAGNLTASVTAHVNDGGTLSYQWYNASDDSEVTGADEATLTTTTEGTYYVIVTNSLADHQDNSTKSNDATLGYRTLNDATLSALSYGDPATAIALEADKYEYRVILNEGTVDVPALHATATMDPYPTVTITDATSFTDYTAQSTVHVTAEDGVTELTYTVNFIVKHIYTSLEDVTASTTWNWTGVEASDVDINDVANRGVILGNYIGGSNFEMMEGKAGEKAFRNQNDGVYQGTYLHFNTTVPGRVKFYFRAPSGGENCTITVKNGGRTVVAGTRGNSFGWSDEVFVNGDVVIEMVNDKEGGGTTRVQQVVFTAADPDYTRDVTEGRYGTICLPNGGVMVGAELFEVAYYGATSQKVFLDNILSGEMEAGVPYIFLPREGASQLGVFYTDEANAPQGNHNGLFGFIGASADEYYYIPDGEGNYILQNNLYREVLAGAQARILSNRAYIKLSAINPSEPALVPGRRRVSMSVLSEQVTTGMENTGFESEAPRKVLINGELFIIRGEKMFDAKGQLVK